VVCGHIHIPGEIKVEGTRIINPGQFKIIEFNVKKERHYE
jgi:Icc-related predicted phosphoesterase